MIRAQSKSHIWSRRFFSAWLVIAAIIALTHVLDLKNQILNPYWVGLHVITLGIIGTSILTWSWHFTATLTRYHEGETAQLKRLCLYTAGTVILVAGMSLGSLAASIIGMTTVLISIGWHATAITTAIKHPWGTRMRRMAHYYTAAMLCLIVGIALAYLPILASYGALSPPLTLMADQAITAHATVNLYGFAGLTILGTAVTFGPTIMHTRMHQHAYGLAIYLLPFLVTSVVLMAIGAALDLPRILLFASSIYVAAAVGIVLPIAIAAYRVKRTDYASLAFLSGLIWISGGWLAYLSATFKAILSASPPRPYTATAITLLLLGTGNILFGSLSYLFPTLIGGGPQLIRAAKERSSKWTWERLSVTTLGGLLLLHSQSSIRSLAIIVLIAGITVTMTVLVRSARQQVKAIKETA